MSKLYLDVNRERMKKGVAEEAALTQATLEATRDWQGRIENQKLKMSTLEREYQEAEDRLLTAKSNKEVAKYAIPFDGGKILKHIDEESRAQNDMDNCQLRYEALESGLIILEDIGRELLGDDFAENRSKLRSKRN